MAVTKTSIVIAGGLTEAELEDTRTTLVAFKGLSLLEICCKKVLSMLGCQLTSKELLTLPRNIVERLLRDEITVTTTNYEVLRGVAQNFSTEGNKKLLRKIQVFSRKNGLEYDSPSV